MRRLLYRGGGLVVVAAVLLFCYLRIAGTTPVVSDGAGNALQAWDMLHGNPLLHGWWATDVSFWTTELPQFVAVEAVAGLRPEVVHIVSAISYLLLIALAVLVAKGRASGQEAIARVLLAVTIMLAPQLGANTYIVLGTPSHVTSALPVLLVLLVLDRAPRRWWVPVAVGLLLAWGLIADPLVMVVGVFPVIAVFGARGMLASRPSRLAARVPWFEFSMAVAALLAFIAAKDVQDFARVHGGLAVNSLNGISSPGLPGNLGLTVRDALSLFGADLGRFPGLFVSDPHVIPGHSLSTSEVIFAAVHLVGVAAVIAALVMTARGLGSLVRDPDGELAEAVPGVLAVAVVTNVCLYFFLYQVSDMYFGQEIGPVLPLGAALAGRELGGHLARAVRDLDGRRSMVLRSAVVAVLASYCAALGFATAQPQLPPANAPLTSWLRAHGMRSGLAGYWESSSVTLDSGGAITLGAVTANTRGRVAGEHWEADLRLIDPTSRRADFLVLAAGDRPSSRQAIATFGPPDRIYHYQSYTILTWHKNLLSELEPAVG
jgi:hypothetical protein